MSGHQEREPAACPHGGAGSINGRERDLLECAAALLETHPGYRVTRMLPPTGTLVLPVPEGSMRRALVVDTETTSLDRRTGRIIEVSACPVEIDGRGRIVSVGMTRAWLDDPGEPLPPEIAKLTGLCDADLAGERIDDAAVTAMLAVADVVLAHNAAFDRPWWEARWPVAAAKPWACSLQEIDWRDQGFAGRSLEHLLDRVAGYFSTRHRAGTDVEALVTLLAAVLPSGRTAASELILRASLPTWRVGATRAPFAVKDLLRSRGYRWNAVLRRWEKEVAEHARDAEIAWLATEAGCLAPDLSEITWFERHR